MYANYHCKVSNILKPAVLAVNTNLFFSHKSTKGLFRTVNSELNKSFVWFNANKLSLKKDETKDKIKYKLSHKAQKNHNIPRNLPLLLINDEEEIKQVSLI